MKNYFIFATQKFGTSLSAEDLQCQLEANPNFKVTVSPVRVYSCHSYPEKCLLAEVESVTEKEDSVLSHSFKQTLGAAIRNGGAHCLNHGHLGAYRVIFKGVDTYKELEAAVNALIHTVPFLLTVTVDEKPVEGTKVYLGYVLFNCIDRGQKLGFYLKKYVQFGNFEPIEDIVCFG